MAKAPENHQSIYWEHPEGRKSIRIVYDSEHGTVIGFNLMGVRYRSEVCLKWIEEATPVEKVLENLGIANFDPEFYDEYEKEVVKVYNSQTGKNIKLKSRRGLTGALNFLKSKLAV